MESQAIVIDQAVLAAEQAIAVGMANVEALEAAQMALEICEMNQGGGPPAPMVAAAKKKHHVLQDCCRVLGEMRSEIAGFFRKALKQ